ncbi:MAG: hypothetical protein ACRD0K_23375 [Egibacteraceae bacterium]
MRDTVTRCRDTTAQAARCIAAGLADPGNPSLPVTDSRGHELAAALAWMGGVSAEVHALLCVPVAALRAAVAR